MQCEYFALEGISELMSTLDRVSAAFNPALSLEGVLLTMFDERTNLSQQVAENLRGFFAERLLKTTIPRNVRLAEAPSHGIPVALYDPRSRGAEAYHDLALERDRFPYTAPSKAFGRRPHSTTQSRRTGRSERGATKEVAYVALR